MADKRKAPPKTTKPKPKAKAKPKAAANVLPPLIEDFWQWLAKQDAGAVGFFERSDDPAGEAMFEDRAHAAKLRAHAATFARLPDGSQVVLIDPGAGRPLAAVYLGSEGETSTIATSPEELLHLLAKGETGVMELDEEGATGREALARWLADRGVRAPEAPAFDLESFLGGQGAASPPAAPVVATAEPSGAGYAALSPITRRLAGFVGRRADDPALVAFVTGELKKKIPTSLSWSKDYNWVEANKVIGADLLFESHVLHVAYPDAPTSKSNKSFVPYLSAVYFRDKFREPLPFGVAEGMDLPALQAALGAPSGHFGEPPCPYWRRPIDAARAVEFQIVLRPDEPDVSLRVDVGRALSEHGVPGAAVVGLFVAWAAARGLLDEARFSAHAPLLAQVKARAAHGSALVAAALPRGLWDVHLVDRQVDRQGLRSFAYGWFHNSNGFITRDLIDVFTGREGKHGHNEPVLDDDTWEAVDRATPKLDAVFARWLRPSRAD